MQLANYNMMELSVLIAQKVHQLVNLQEISLINILLLQPSEESIMDLSLVILILTIGLHKQRQNLKFGILSLLVKAILRAPVHMQFI